MIRGLFADLTPLRSKLFRNFWISMLLSSAGNQMTNFAVTLQVFRISHSSFDVGAVGLAVAVPAIVLGLFGGMLIDAFDRRNLLIGTSVILMVLSLLFALQAFMGLHWLWLIYLLAAAESAVTAVNNPARTTVTVALLPDDQIQTGMAVMTLAFRGSFIVGPALAGVLTAASGISLCYVVDAASFIVALYGVVILAPMPPPEGASAPRIKDVLEGFSIVRRSGVLAGALLADLNCTFLAMPIALFPAINAARFGGSPSTLGLLSTSIAVGGVIGSVLSGPLTRVRNQGRWMLVGGAVWGAALAGFGFSHELWLALCLLALAGGADVASVVMRSTIIQLATPAVYRGRVNSTDYAVAAGFPQLGNFRAGLVSSVTSPGTSAAIGGIASVIGTGIIAIAAPALLHYRGPRLLDGEPTAQVAA
jgi:MFS family permease